MAGRLQAQPVGDSWPEYSALRPGIMLLTTRCSPHAVSKRSSKLCYSERNWEVTIMAGRSHKGRNTFDISSHKKISLYRCKQFGRPENLISQIINYIRMMWQHSIFFPFIPLFTRFIRKRVECVLCYYKTQLIHLRF